MVDYSNVSVIYAPMNLLSFVLLICSFECHRAIGQRTKDIIVDFNKTEVEIAIRETVSALQFVCPASCSWLLPVPMKSSSQIVIVENNLTVTFNLTTNRDGTFVICQSLVNDTSSVGYFDIPDCCPCCAWYQQTICDRFSRRYTNCSKIVVYSLKAPLQVHDSINTYKNNRFLLQCKTKNSPLKDSLKITIGKDLFADLYSNGSLISNIHNASYNPLKGLCFNSSILEDGTWILCSYPAYELTSQYTVIIPNFRFKKIRSGLLIFSEKDKTKLEISMNQSVIEFVKNQRVKLECHGIYNQRKPLKLLMCMKFDFHDRIPWIDFHCKEVLKEFRKTWTIDTNDLRNGSEIMCLLENPTKTDLNTIKLTVQVFDKEVLEIIDPDNWRNRTIKIFEDQTDLRLDIFFHSIPTNNDVNCSMENHKEIHFKDPCSVKVSGLCICVFETHELFVNKTSKTVSFLVFNRNITRSVSVLLQPVYIGIPQLMGLDPIFQKYKYLQCQSSSSKPYNVSWIIEIDNERYIHYSENDTMIIGLNDTTKRVCCQCTIENESGSKPSERVCQTIIDIDIPDMEVVKVFLVNSTTWDSKTERGERVRYLSSAHHSILDIGPINILCASRIKEDPIVLKYNNSTIPAGEVITQYTRQSSFQLDIGNIKNQSFSGSYTCIQTIANGIQHSSTIEIKVLRTIIPIVEKKSKDLESKFSFMVGQDVHLRFTVQSFPPCKVKIFSVNSTNPSKLVHRNLSISFQKVNSSNVIVHVTFYNINKSDSGKYFLRAGNIIGSNNFPFSLDIVEARFNLKIYYIIGGILVIIVVIFGLVFRFSPKSGSAMPFYQIQNRMYKSLDSDYVQLLNNIWPDPLERKKWTIKPSCRIRIMKEIGQGNYGKIYKGILTSQNRSSEQLVALKRPILSSKISKGKNMEPLQLCQISLDCFMNEIKVLSKLTNCPNIIKMYGCTVFRNEVIEEEVIKEPTTLLVLEYCTNRSLNEFLTKNSVMYSPYTKFRKLTESNGYTGMKMDEGLTLLDLKKISLGIAIGLDYLSGLNIIHRDLATRNILLDDQKSPKICDFGLAIELEKDFTISNCYQILTHNKALPFKILPPEVLESKLFCLESDIWSYGLLLWQMFNLEQETLFPQSENPASLIKYIRSRIGHSELRDLLPLPKFADEPIWKLIKACWAFEPVDRPSAHCLRMQLVEIVRNSPVEVIRVSSDCPPYVVDPTSRESISSSKFPSTRTSLVTLNYPILPGSNSPNHKLGFYDGLSSETLIDESPL